MPVYKLQSRFTRTRTLIVEAPDEKTLYEFADQDFFDPDNYRGASLEDWGDPPVEVREAPPATVADYRLVNGELEIA